MSDSKRKQPRNNNKFASVLDPKKNTIKVTDSEKDLINSLREKKTKLAKKIIKKIFAILSDRNLLYEDIEIKLWNKMLDELIAAIEIEISPLIIKTNEGLE